MANLKRLVKQWVLAEYYCRRPFLLPENRQGLATWRLIEAEGELRKAITRKADLVEAALELGAKPYKPSKLKKHKKKPRVRAKTRRVRPGTLSKTPGRKSRKPKGFFSGQ